LISRNIMGENMTSDPKVLFETSGPIATITLNRPDQRNAVDGELGDQLRRAVDQFEADARLRVGILRGNGRVFCAGMDLQAFTGGQAEQILYGAGGFGGLTRRRRTKPMIAAVHGAALAGGFELVLACDMVVAAAGTIFGLPEVKLGLIAGAGGAFRISRHLPKALAHELLLTGRPIDMQTAQAFGLINDLVPLPELYPAAQALAASIAANAPLSVTASLALASQCTRQSEESLWTMSDAILREMSASQDATEGATAFVEKRAPQWQGR